MSIKKYKGAKGKADVLASKIIRYNKRCLRCGSSQNMQASHIIPRRFSATRTRIDNLQPLCAKCHAWFTARPVEFGKWVFQSIGEEKYNELHEASLVPTKMDWDEELARLTEVYKNIENDWIID